MEFAGLLLNCATSRWSPVVGDPSVMGWLTVACYVGVCLAALQGAKHQTLPVRRMFWSVLALALAALALNKQLDLQSALTAIGRCHAKATGWYDHRRIVQAGVIAVLLLVSFVGGVTLWRRLHTHLHVLWPAVLGITVLLSFIAIRAVGFHHVDTLIGFHLGSVKLNWILELSGIALIGCGAILAIRKPSN